MFNLEKNFTDDEDDEIQEEIKIKPEIVSNFYTSKYSELNETEFKQCQLYQALMF